MVNVFVISNVETHRCRVEILEIDLSLLESE